MSWTAADIPSQAGRVAVITGANGGLGLATARALAAKGAHVVMAARNAVKAEAARARLVDEHPGARLEVVPLDLGSLASVAQAADRIRSGHPQVDLLICNAGVMALPQGRTADGFETQFGTNHLGHWALTAHLLPAILRAPAARVVTVCSGAQHLGRAVDPADPHLAAAYGPWKAYGQSKLANRHFAVGLQRRFAAAGARASALTAHPGLTNSDLQTTSAHAGGAGPTAGLWVWLARMLGMSIDRGALSQLRAATDPAAPGGSMYGPLLVSSGPPVRKPLIRPGSVTAIETLWAVSRRETGLDIDVAATLAELG